ncbi:MAG: sensor histidine kinase [Ignavibacteriae bacterium]|nr:sensor histidine kinase [Ignavibacteriota bacterium]
MKTGYWFKASKDDFGITNLPENCSNCIRICETDNEVIECLHFAETRRRGMSTIARGKMYICTNEAIASKRLFREQQAVLRELLPMLDQHRSQLTASFQESIRRIAHNLITLNAESIQAIYSAIPQEEFSQPDRNSLIEHITRKVQIDPKSFALLILDLIKNERLVKTEFSVYSKLYENEPPEKRPYNIHKILMLVLNTFWDDFNDIGVNFRVGNCIYKVNVDYECIAASFVHILQNATKYILPNSVLNISFTKHSSRITISFSMTSLRIEPEEEQSIFSEGYSGINPQKIGKAGRGLGLPSVKKLLALCDGQITLRREQSTAARINHLGLPYDINIFDIILPAYDN